MLKQLAFKKPLLLIQILLFSYIKKSFKDLYKKYHDKTTNPYKEPKDLIKHKMLMSNSNYFFHFKPGQTRWRDQNLNQS